MDRNDIYEELVEGEAHRMVNVVTIEDWEGMKPLFNDLNISNNPIKRGHLHFMIGLPRSGKSTWATAWMRTSIKNNQGDIVPRAVVCADDIRLAISGQRFNSKIEPMVHMVKDYMIESLLSRGHDVLVDGTHTTRPSLRRMLQIDIDASYTHIATPSEVCKQRAVDCGQEDLVPIIDRMAKQLQGLLDTGISSLLEELRQEVKRYGEHRMA